MSIHTGHRERLKERFRQEGLDNFDELYVLELLLYYCIPRMDTNPIAHRLLDHFGSLPAVLDARIEELEKIEGIGKNAATFLSLITEVGRYYQTRRKEDAGIVLSNMEKCCNYLVSQFIGRQNETVYMLCLDAKSKMLCCRKVGEGSVNSANIPIRRVVEIALGVNATSVILAHNHPSGLALPSADDIQTTHRVAAALNAVDIVLVDHIIVANDDYISLSQSNRYQPNAAEYL